MNYITRVKYEEESHPWKPYIPKNADKIILGTFPTAERNRAYYDRKVDEGKNKMSIINAIRSKLIHRIFAVIRDDRKYEKNHTHILV